MGILLVMYLVVSVLLVGLSIPLILGKIKPNPLYGFRVSQTLENPDLWYAVNRYAGKRLVVAGLAIMVGSVILYFIPGISIDTYALGCLAFFGVPFIVGLYQDWRYLRSLSK
jgi:uncharacterized membrane protein